MWKHTCLCWLLLGGSSLLWAQSPGQPEAPTPPETPAHVTEPVAAPPAPPAAPATPATSATPAPTGPTEDWITEFDMRIRGESWDWFAPPSGGNDYSYAHARLRARLGYRVPKEWEALVEVQDVQMLGLPTTAIGPGAIGQMGLGGILYGHSGRTSLNTAGVRQAYFKVGDPDRFQVQLGRMEYASGMQVVPKDAALAQVKRTRIKDRFIGTFEFSAYSRSFDGIRIDGDTGEFHLSGFAAKPTQGGFEPHFADTMSDVFVSEVSLTAKQGELLPDGEAQLFWDYYDDHRRVPQVDNRPVARRGQIYATGGNQIHTVGFHLLHKLGEQGDFLAWYAHQTGRWGALNHQADAFSLELGYQWKEADWQPWLRGGYTYFSGDSNPLDGSHGTFYPMLPTIRPYAMMPFYTESNLRDAFVQLMLKPGSQTTARIDAHFLNLATPNDLWYAGSGATQNAGTIQGFAGRPSGGGSHLGTLLDLSIDHQIDPNHKLSFYAGHVFGGDVPAASYAANPNANFFFLEYQLKLP